MRPAQVGKIFEGDALEVLRATVPKIGRGWCSSFNDRITVSGFGARKFVIKHPTPVDMIFISPEINLLVECKAVVLDKPGKKFGFDAVKPHQKEALAGFTVSGERNLGVVFVYFYVKGRPRSNMFILPYWSLSMIPRSFGPDVNISQFGGIVGPVVRNKEGLSKKHIRQLIRMRDEFDETDPMFGL
jgi:hypothetical protein